MIKLKDLYPNQVSFNKKKYFGETIEEAKYTVYFDVGSPGLMSKKVSAKNEKEAAKKVASGLSGGLKLIKKVEKESPSLQVKEDLNVNFYSQIRGQAKYLLDSAKNLQRAIKNQNDMTTIEEIEYIHTKSKLMLEMAKDKKYQQ